MTRCILISLIDILGCTTGIRKVFSCFSWILPNQSWKWLFHHFLQRSHNIDYFRSCTFLLEGVMHSGSSSILCSWLTWVDLGLVGWGLGYSKAEEEEEEDEEDEEWLPRKSDVGKKGNGRQILSLLRDFFTAFLSDDVTTHPSGWRILGPSYRILMWSSEANGDRWWCFELDSCPPWPMTHSWSCCWALTG